MIDETKGVPNVPEALVFDNKDDAREWVKALDMELYNFDTLLYGEDRATTSVRILEVAKAAP